MFNHTPLARRFRDPLTGQYVYVFAESLRGFWLVNVDGSGQRRLLPQALVRADWDSTGTALAYEQGAAIWTLAGSDSALDGGSASQITGSERAFGPSWRPDGAALAFSVNAGVDAGVYIVPKGGGVSQRVGEIGWRDPDWAPSGDSLVFVATKDARTGICVADTSGQGFRMLWGYPQATVYFPRWSRDGARIAFTGRPSDLDPIQLWIMDASGTNAHPLTSEAVLIFFGWSPDAKEIAYVRFSQSDPSLENGTIWIIDVTSGAKRQLTFNTPSN